MHLTTLKLLVLAVCVLSGVKPDPIRIYYKRPHQAPPTWFPKTPLTWVQKVYYVMTSYLGSVFAAGVGTLFGPLGTFVSAFTQPWFSKYTSRMTEDVLSRSLENGLDFMNITEELLEMEENNSTLMATFSNSSDLSSAQENIHPSANNDETEASILSDLEENFIYNENTETSVIGNDDTQKSDELMTSKVFEHAEEILEDISRNVL